MKAAERPSSAPIRFVIVTLDAHLAGAAERTASALRAEGVNVELTMHVASDWMRDASTIEPCRRDIATADLIIVTQLFMDDQVSAIRDALAARADHCDAVMVALCAAELMKFTRMRGFSMGGSADNSAWSPMSIMRRLLGGKRTAGSSGERQMSALRRVPKMLKYVPGTAQDVRAYYIMLQYWLAGSSENLTSAVRYFVSRYASMKTVIRDIAPPQEYPETGLYHPAIRGRVSTSLADLPSTPASNGRVGLLVIRFVRSGTKHSTLRRRDSCARSARTSRDSCIRLRARQPAGGGAVLRRRERLQHDRCARVADRIFAGGRARLQRCAGCADCAAIA